MQHLENDMDELFKRSAENYLLDEGEGDWEAVAGKLEQYGKAEMKHKRRFLATACRKLSAPALFLFVAIFSPKTIADVNLIKFGFNNQKIIQQFSVINNPAHLNNYNINHQLVSDTKPKSENSIFNSSGDVPEKRLSSVSAGEKAKSPMMQHFAFFKDNIPVKQSGDPVYSQPEINKQSKSAGAARLSVKITPSIAFTNEIVPDINLVVNKAPSKKLNTHRFYVGLFGAVDASKVRSMPFGKAGYGVGFLLGRHLSGRLSLEASLSLQRKQYETYGKDFSVVKIASTMPSGMMINSLHSTTSLKELNISAAYNILEQKRSSISLAMGLSEYIVTKERNTYNVSLNGTDKIMKGNYETNLAKLPAVVSLGIRYDYKLGDKSKIRIEPFLKYPSRALELEAFRLPRQAFR